MRAEAVELVAVCDVVFITTVVYHKENMVISADCRTK